MPISEDTHRMFKEEEETMFLGKKELEGDETQEQEEPKKLIPCLPMTLLILGLPLLGMYLYV